MLNLTHAEIGLIVVEVSILVSLLIVILLVKKSTQGFPGKGLPGRSFRTEMLASYGKVAEPGKWGELVQESQPISSRLNKNLEEKKELTRSLMKRLDEKIQELDHRVNPGGPAEEDVYQKALAMSNAGAALADISRALKLPRGEVQLIFDLQKYCR